MTRSLLARAIRRKGMEIFKWSVEPGHTKPYEICEFQSPTSRAVRFNIFEKQQLSRCFQVRLSVSKFGVLGQDSNALTVKSQMRIEFVVNYVGLSDRDYIYM